jgi:hypothetical protein
MSVSMRSSTNGQRIKINERAIELAKMFCLNEEAVFTINCGLHSGFSECCVMFHTTTYLPISYGYDIPLYRDVLRAYRKATPNCHCVLCPACIIHNRIPPSPVECICWMEKRVLKMVRFNDDGIILSKDY